MEEGLFWVYGIGAPLLPFVLLFLCSLRGWSRCGSSRMGYRLTMVLFALYICCVFFVTSAGTIYDGILYGWEFREDQINLIPFSREIDGMVYLLNVAMFVPLGFLSPFLFQERDRLLPVLLDSLGFSLVIELSQLLNNRRTDVDDLILNVLGGCLGFVCFRVVQWLARGRIRPVSRSGWNFWAVVLLIFFGRFFLFDEVGLAAALYRF